MSARAVAPISRGGKQLRTESVEQVEKGRLEGPFPIDTEGQLLPGNGPQVVGPALRFRAALGESLGAVDDLRGSQTHRAAASRTPVILPT